MLFNELAQWAALIFVAVLVFGLIRQLGHFIVPRRDHLLYLGPEIGRALPTDLLEGEQAAAFRERVRATDGGLGLIAVMNDKCHGCHGLVGELQALGRPQDIALAAVIDSSTPEFDADVASVFSTVVSDEGAKRARAAGIVATPFVLGVDADLVVRHHGISGGIYDLVEEWTGARPAAVPFSRSGEALDAALVPAG